jgi:hypothetical protein
LAEAAEDWAHLFPRLLALLADTGHGSMLPFDLLSAADPRGDNREDPECDADDQERDRRQMDSDH